jgi:glycosyltransferase involved in cell wall biosynthesis
MNSPRHIGLLTPYLSGVTGIGSGIGEHFRHLADGLVSAGHRVTCLVPFEQTPVNLPADLPFQVVAAVARPSRLLLLAGRFSWQLHQWYLLRARHRAAAIAAASCPSVEIWETTASDSPALDLLRVAHHAPVLTRVSTTASQLRLTNLGAKNGITCQKERWEKRAVRTSDAVVTHTQSHRVSLARQFGLDPARVLLVPHGISLPPPLLPRAYTSAPRLLFVGRLERRKGIDLLLAALPAALISDPSVTADLIGLDQNGFWQNHWLTHAPAELQNRVQFHGLLPQANLERAYAEADIFVGPSRYESFGLTFVEAMSRGLPVVALAAPGAMDIIEPEITGLLTPPEDVTALGGAIIRLIKDSFLRRRLGEAGRAIAVSRYSRETLVNNSLTAYAAVTSHRTKTTD